jgi:ABC-2 type transport system ATP-binding protein
LSNRGDKGTPSGFDTNLVLIDQVVKSFNNRVVLNALTTRFQGGLLTGLVGPDGAGKTTLLRLIAGLLQPDQGLIQLLGQDVSTDTEAMRVQVGYMPQRFGLYEDLTVQENLDLYASLKQVPINQHSRVFQELLDFTRLDPFKSRLAGRLSGGMKQKLGLACAMISEPKVLLLDEPSVGVDPVSRQDLWRMVSVLTAKGVAVVWATAYLDEAERCQRVLLLNEGSVLFDGAPERLTDRMTGRLFSISQLKGDRREHLSELLRFSSVTDGVIQGDTLRIVTRSVDDLSQLQAYADRWGADIQPTAPRFEDGFIDQLGGGPGGRSELAERISQKNRENLSPVECRQLSKRFGDFVATDSVSFSVRSGEIFGLLGPNGAGKSTTFKMLCGLLKATSGEALVTGLNLRTASSEAKSQLGYMAQKFSLYGLLSVLQNLEFSAGVYGLAGEEKRTRIAEMIEIFHLEPYLHSPPNDLPLGFKQRLALACAVIHHPPVLFLDEPTSGVDPITRREFWTHINAMVQKGVTVLVTTHFMDEAEYCDRVALMHQSRLIALDTPDGLKARVQAEGRALPTMEETFIALIEDSEKNTSAAPPQRFS